MKKFPLATVIAVSVVIGSGICMICGVDYFCNGCIVDYDYTVTTKLPNGRMITTYGTECHQFIIHTKQGARMAKLYPE